MAGLDGNETAGYGDCLYLGRSQVGVITSGTRLPILCRNIALCRMAIEYSEIGTKVGVGKLDGHRKRSRPRWSGSCSTTRTRPARSLPPIPLGMGLPCAPPRWHANSGYSWEVSHGC